PQNRQAMLHQVSNPEVPIEATFKWLVKENKRLKDREALLTEYAKRLEDYTKRRAEKAARYSKAELQAINHGHRKG
ncbi:MAG: hypothetical protein IJI97_06155, partial [Clostridia bacterium]|nr:hypothetical protein [Clostridia bacterium]